MLHFLLVVIFSCLLSEVVSADSVVIARITVFDDSLNASNLVFQCQGIIGSSGSPAIDISDANFLSFSPIYACSAYDGNETVVANKDNVGLSFRGNNCSFTEKADNAEAFGLTALLIGNQQDNAQPIRFISQNQNVMAISISEENLLSLQQFAITGEHTMDITYYVEESTNFLVNFKYVVLLLSFLLVSFLGFVATGYFWKQRTLMRLQHEVEQRLEELKSTRQQALKDIPVIPYKKPTDEDDPDDPDSTAIFCASCAICLEEFEEGDRLLQLPCNHVLHKDCVEPWLLQKGTCPFCKMDFVTKKYPQYDDMSETLSVNNTIIASDTADIERGDESVLVVEDTSPANHEFTNLSLLPPPYESNVAMKTPHSAPCLNNGEPDNFTDIPLSSYPANNNNNNITNDRQEKEKEAPDHHGDLVATTEALHSEENEDCVLNID